MRPILRLGSIAASAGLIIATLTAAPATAFVSAPAPDQKPVKTGFALFASAYGSSVQGGQIPAGSDGTAYAVIGCTTRAGKTRGNYEAKTTLPGLGTASAVRTKLWTTKKGKVVSSWSAHSIAEVMIADTPLGSLSIEGIKSLSRAYHDGKRFRTDHVTSVAKIVLKPMGAPAQELEIPTPGQPLVVPGLARISIGHTVTAKIPDGIRAAADALDILVIPTGTRTRIAHTSAKIERGVPFGTFRGYSAGTKARGLGQAVKSGRTPLSILGCKGTKGKVMRKAVARVNLGDNLVVRGVHNAQYAKQSKGKATAFERSSIAGVNLGDGALVINAITAKANVTRTNKTLVRNVKGTKIGEIIANGQTYEFPKSGVIEIPGLVRIEDQIVKKIKNGISVVALRITLLDGTGAVIDLGMAEVRIRKG